MFNLIKSLLVFMVVLSLSACTLFQPKQQVVTSNIVMAPIEAVILPVNIEVDPLPIAELPVPIVPLNERYIVKLTDAEVQCMAKTIYHEAKGESEVGMRAVGYLTLNRAAHPAYPKTICGVIHSKYQGKYEYNWVGMKLPIREQDRYAMALKVSRDVLTRTVPNPIDDSLFFRNKSAHRQLRYERYVATIGNHRFYARR